MTMVGRLMRKMLVSELASVTRHIIEKGEAPPGSGITPIVH